MKKDRGISAKVSKDYYRMMKKTRIILKNKYGVNINSDVKLTKLMSLYPLYENKQWIKKVKKWNGY